MACLSAQGRPGLLLGTTEGSGPRPPALHLAGLTASFGVVCTVAVAGSSPEQRTVSVVECTAGQDAVPLFAEAAGTFLRLLGPAPTMAEAATAVARFAAIFASLAGPSRQGVTGLIGEFMLLLLAADPALAVMRWRAVPTERFDFSAPDARVEAKATSSGLRLHSFSWEQCNPPAGPALAASMRVEPAGGGTSVRDVLDRIEARLAAAPEAAARLRETVASTMGGSLLPSLDVRFDEALCGGSLLWFDMRSVPAIRGSLPAGVAGVRFTSDVSQAAPVPAASLAGTQLACLMPSS